MMYTMEEYVDQLALECETGPSQAAMRHKAVAAVLRAYAATLRQPDSGRVGDAMVDVVDAAVEAFDDVYDGVSHNKREAIQHAITAALAAQGQGDRCTCPSGDGSLHWPCPQHPAPAASPAGVPDGWKSVPLKFGSWAHGALMDVDTLGMSKMDAFAARYEAVVASAPSAPEGDGGAA
jgi:hypothetical protein